MALITCPECEKTISDRAIACPNCLYRIREHRHHHAAPKTPKLKAATDPGVPVALQYRFLRGGFWSLTGQKGVMCRCPLCGASTSVELGYAGAEVVCLNCHKRFRVPTGDQQSHD